MPGLRTAPDKSGFKSPSGGAVHSPAIYRRAGEADFRDIPEATDLQEVKSMLAERAMDWTQQWKQEGLEEGLQEGRQEALAEVRAVLVRELERRFGPLPEQVRRRVEAITSLEDLTAFSIRAGSVSSFDELS
jgi:flagellar biosynthesis/type III secretory pathway protein FliH